MMVKAAQGQHLVFCVWPTKMGRLYVCFCVFAKKARSFFAMHKNLFTWWHFEQHASTLGLISWPPIYVCMNACVFWVITDNRRVVMANWVICMPLQCSLRWESSPLVQPELCKTINIKWIAMDDRRNNWLIVAICNKYLMVIDRGVVSFDDTSTFDECEKLCGL